MVRYLANAFNCVPKTKLVYTLKPLDHALVFQVHEQSQDISDFLANNTYRAKNGLLIAANKYPEFQESGKSGDVVVYLQGNDTARNSKLDVTRFVGNMQRDAKKAMVDAALAEFVDFMKARKPAYIYSPEVCYDEYFLVLS